MGWKFYELDRVAQKLVIDAKHRDDRLAQSSQKSLPQAHKMRMAVAYGLERFWGEHLRLEAKEENKSMFWQATWTEFVGIMQRAGVEIPNTTVDRMPEKLWALEPETQRVALAVLTQLCDAIIWWTQRYKKGSFDNDN
jgi:hypothetical protein